MDCASWSAALDARPWRDPRQIGRWLMWLGIGAMLAGTFLTPPFGKIGIACAAAGALLARPPLPSPVLWAGGALAAWLLASVAAGWLRGEPGAGRLPGLAYAWLAVPIGAACATDARWRAWALRALVAVAAAAAVVGLAQFCIGLGAGPLKIDAAGERFARAVGFGGVHLHFGYNGAVLAALCLAGGLGPPARWQQGGAVCALVIVAISGARNGLLGCAASVAAVLMARGGRWLWVGAVSGAAALLLAAGLLAATAPARLQSMLAGQDGRWPIWRTSVATLAERPLLGYGSRDAWKARYLQIYGQVNPGGTSEFAGEGPAHPHNWLLAVANDHGVPAALLHLGLIGTVLALVWRRRRERPAAFRAACGVATAGLVCGMFEPLPVLAATGAGFHAMLGLCLGAALAAEPPPEPPA